MPKTHGLPETAGNPAKKPAAILFDWDGTLVDSYGFLNKAHNTVLQQLGMAPMVEGGFHAYFGLPREQLFIDIYGAERAEDAKLGFEQYYLANHLHDLSVLPGVADMLEVIAAQRVTMGVVSNKKPKFLQAEVDYLGWDRYFGDLVIGAGMAAADKPDPAPLLMAAKALGITDLSSIWYVGDTHIDAQCAQAAGSPCFLVAPVEHESAAGADVKNYSQLCGFLLQCV